MTKFELESAEEPSNLHSPDRKISLYPSITSPGWYEYWETCTYCCGTGEDPHGGEPECPVCDGGETRVRRMAEDCED